MFLSLQPVKNDRARTPRLWIFVCFIVSALVIGFFILRTHTEQKESASSVNPVKQFLHIGSIVPRLLGIPQRQTYLLLFQNNTEMRPSGGFLGSYGILIVEGGVVKEFFTDGTENLDAQAPDTFRIPSPRPLAHYLEQKNWFFRDANWSADFPTSAKQALQMYSAEGGRYADHIDGVIALTPTVLSQLLGVIGPLRVSGVHFTPDDVIETLEYHVEYGYAHGGTGKQERKKIIGELGRELLERIQKSPRIWKALFTILADSLQKKQVLLFSVDENLQKKFVEYGWAGELTNPNGDFVMVVDANLASLKTDLVMDRSLVYSIFKNAGGNWNGKVDITYTHTGTFDWKTTRYRTYTRIYLPQGSKLIRASGQLKKDRSSEEGIVDIEEELGKTVFGAFTAIEPKTTRTLSFLFTLAPSIQEHIRSGSYTLFVQKQAGTHVYPLTLDLNFGTTLLRATPAEVVEEWKDGRYRVETNLETDRSFAVNF